MSSHDGRRPGDPISRVREAQKQLRIAAMDLDDERVPPSVVPRLRSIASQIEHAARAIERADRRAGP